MSNYCPQEGKGMNGQTIRQGENVRWGNSVVEVESLHGGSHTRAVVRSSSGHAYTVDTADLSK